MGTCMHIAGHTYICMQLWINIRINRLKDGYMEHLSLLRVLDRSRCPLAVQILWFARTASHDSLKNLVEQRGKKRGEVWEGWETEKNKGSSINRNTCLIIYFEAEVRRRQMKRLYTSFFGWGAVGFCFGAVNCGLMELAMETRRGYKNYVDRNAGLSLSCGWTA